MADCVITVEVGFGADSKATAGYILVRRVAEGRDGAVLVLSDYRQYDFRPDEPLTITVEQGAVYESVEMRPRGKTRVWQVPAVSTFNYSDLEWLKESSETPGTYVLEPPYVDYAGTTGEPDIAAESLWYPSNPLHPDHGYIMKKKGS